MNTSKRLKIYGLLSLLFVAASCVDHIPLIEELPSTDVAFNYSVSDDSYQLDYYVGANIKFKSFSAAEGECDWDFGDGNKAVGDSAVHKYTNAGTYVVRLTVSGAGYIEHKILISDIKPILKLNLVEGGLCEVLTSSVSFNVELPNPEGLDEEYNWTFPVGALDENNVLKESFSGKDPGKIKFSHVGSQQVRLQVKLGGRVLEDGVINVPVAYNQAR